MSFQTNPTFVDAAVLSASDLNILSDNTEFLHGLVSGVNTPFAKVEYTSDWDDTDTKWEMVHSAQYLHFKARLTMTDVTSFQIWVAGVKVYEDTTQRAAVYTYQGYVDLDASAASLTLGDPYEVYLAGTFTTSPPHKLIVDYLRESGSTTL